MFFATCRPSRSKSLLIPKLLSSQTLKYSVTVLIFLGFFGFVLMIPQAVASEPSLTLENSGDASPDSCTRWQQWDYGYCVDKTGYSSHLGAAHFLQIITVPFIGFAAIFVVSATTPRMSKKKRVAVIVPCVIFILFSLFVIFIGGFWFF